MKNITPHVREEHIEQLRFIQESADGDISEAVRRIFDRAAETKRTEAERESIRYDCESEIDAFRSEHESGLASLRSEYES